MTPGLHQRSVGILVGSFHQGKCTCLFEYDNSGNRLKTAPISIVSFTWITRLEYQISDKHCNNTALPSTGTISRLGSVLAYFDCGTCPGYRHRSMFNRIYRSRASRRFSQHSVSCVLDHLQAVDPQRRQALEVFLLTFTAESTSFLK